MKQDKQQLPFKVKIGYSLGQFGEGTAYSIFYYFYTYFLVSVVGISPGIAGTLSGLAIIWDAVTDPMCGIISDRSKSKIGRRRNFIFKASIPLAISIILLFLKPNLSGTSLIVYIIVTNIMFWIFFTFCDIPWLALGNELTNNYDEKTKIRSLSTISMAIGTLIASGLTLPVVNKLTYVLNSEKYAWAIWGTIIGVLSAIGFLVSAISTKGRDTQIIESDTNKKDKFSRYKFLVSRKNSVLGYFPLLLLTIFATTASGIWCSGSIFLMKISYGLSETQASIFNVVGQGINFILIPVLGFMAQKFDKRNVMIFGFLLNGVVSIVIAFFSGNNYLLLLSIIVYFIADTSFWTLVFAALGDVTECDYIKSGVDRCGTLTSFVSVGTKFGYAIGMYLLGIGLDLIHYTNDLTVYSNLSSKVRYITYIPIGIFHILCFVCMVVYPLSRRKYNDIKNNIEV